MKKNIFIASICLALASCSVTFPVAATSNPVGAKVGSAKASFVLGIPIDGGDVGIQKASQNGGIKRISTVDFKHTNYLGIYQIFETIITGD